MRLCDQCHIIKGVFSSLKGEIGAFVCFFELLFQSFTILFQDYVEPFVLVMDDINTKIRFITCRNIEFMTENSHINANFICDK